jgi:hypothetical protein
MKFLRELLGVSSLKKGAMVAVEEKSPQREITLSYETKRSPRKKRRLINSITNLNPVFSHQNT